MNAKRILGTPNIAARLPNRTALLKYKIESEKVMMNLFLFR